jgi:hypothetical protein
MCFHVLKHVKSCQETCAEGCYHIISATAPRCYLLPAPSLVVSKPSSIDSAIVDQGSVEETLPDATSYQMLPDATRCYHIISATAPRCYLLPAPSLVVSKPSSIDSAIVDQGSVEETLPHQLV